MNNLIFNENFTLNNGHILNFSEQFLYSINELNINDGVKYKVIRVNKTPNKEINTYSTPGMNGINYISDYKKGGTGTIDMYVQGRNADEFMENLYKLKYEINKGLVFLRSIINNHIEQGEVVFEGEPTTFEHYNTYWIPIQLNFTYFNFLNNSNKFGLTYRVPDVNYRYSIFYKGYAPVLPNITINLFKNISKLKILNELNSDYIEITQNLSVGDVLFLDFEKAKLFLNNVEILIDFDGTFFEFLHGENILNITTEGSSGTGEIMSVIVQYVETVY